MSRGREVWEGFSPRTRRVLYAIDRFLGGGITVTERLVRLRARGHWLGVQGCRALDKVDQGHCDRFENS